MLAFHTIVGLVALASGLLVMLRAKGTGPHRAVGWTYAASMYVLCATSFGIGATASRPFVTVLGVGWGMFHVMALVSVATLTAGLVPVLRRRPPSWFENHIGYMLWSYVGLVMALNSHFMAVGYRALRPQLGSAALTWSLLIALGWVLPFAVGLTTIPRATSRYLRTFRVPSAAAPPSPAAAGTR